MFFILNYILLHLSIYFKYILIYSTLSEAAWNPNADNGPKVHYNIPTEMRENGKQLDRFEQFFLNLTQFFVNY